MSDREFLQEIEAFLCFNLHPSKEDILQLKQDLQKHLEIPIKSTLIELQSVGRKLRENAILNNVI